MNNKKDKILIMLPAYNEAKVIGNVIKEIKQEGFKDILIIDDASKDNTSTIASKAGAKVLIHPINRGGPGAPTMTGIIYARRNNYDHVVIMDSDGQHSPKDIKKLLQYSNKYDVIIGSRLKGDISNMPTSRKLVNFIGSFVTWFFFGLFVWDSQSGFKVLNKKAIEKINITYDTYEFCSEMIGEIKSHHLSYIEVPIKVIYTHHSLNKQDTGQSFWNGFRMGIKFLLRK